MEETSESLDVLYVAPTHLFPFTHFRQTHSETRLRWKTIIQWPRLLPKHGTLRKEITPFPDPLYAPSSPWSNTTKDGPLVKIGAHFLSLLSCFHHHNFLLPQLGNWGSRTSSKLWPNSSGACWEYRHSNRKRSCFQFVAPVCSSFLVSFVGLRLYSDNALLTTLNQNSWGFGA